MNVTSLFTAKPLLAGIVGLLVVGVVQTMRLHFAQSELAVAVAAADVARANTVAAITERDATQLAYANANEAASSWQAVAEERLGMLTECQIERDRIGAESYAGIAVAEAAERKAKEDLRVWRGKYELAIREPTCAAARTKLDASCPAEDY